MAHSVLLAIAFIFVLSYRASADELTVGGVVRYDSSSKGWSKSLDATYISGYHIGGVAQYENRNSWLIGTRGYLTKHIFLQEGFRFNKLTLINPKLRPVSHPYVIQTGLGADYRFGREHIIASISLTDRWRTIQDGFIYTFNSYYRIGNGWEFRLSYLHSKVLSQSTQTGVGICYTFSPHKLLTGR